MILGTITQTEIQETFNSTCLLVQGKKQGFKLHRILSLSRKNNLVSSVAMCLYFWHWTKIATTFAAARLFLLSSFAHCILPGCNLSFLLSFAQSQFLFYFIDHIFIPSSEELRVANIVLPPYFLPRNNPVR